MPGKRGGAPKAKRSTKGAKVAPPRKDRYDARSNKKGEVIAMMKRAKGATVPPPRLIQELVQTWKILRTRP